jgi:hypothetical protein
MDGSLKHLCRAAASFNKHFKRNKNSWLGSASLHILTNYFCPLKWALYVATWFAQLHIFVI